MNNYYYSSSKDIKYSVFDADAQAYFDVATFWSYPEQVVINNFFVTLENNSLKDQVDASYLLRAGSYDNAKWNLMNPADSDGAFRLTEGGTGHTYNENGFKGNTTGYLDTHVATNTLTQDDNHIALFSNTSGGVDGTDMGSWGSGFSNGLYILYRWSDNQDYSKNAIGTGDRAYGSDTGFYLNRRGSSAEYKLDRGAAGTITVTATSVTLNSNTIYIGAAHQDAGATQISNRYYSYASIGSNFTDEEAAIYKTAVETMLSGLESLTATLLFSSGFESTTVVGSPVADYQYITGTDASTGFTWPPTIWGSSGNGIHRVLDDGGPAITNELQTVTGHGGGSTTALYQEVAYNLSVTQSPYQINNISADPDEFYIKYWMKIDATSLSTNGSWRAIWEYKSDEWFDSGGSDGFRAIAFIGRNGSGELYWRIQGDDNPSSPIWGIEKTNSQVTVPREEWFKVEYYVKVSNASDGIVWMKVNDTLIGEQSGATLGSGSDTIAFMMLTQIYGNTTPMHQWIDDIEIWDKVPY